MKHFLTLSVAILATAATATAQQSKTTFLQPQSNKQPMHARMMNMLLSRTDNGLAQKTTVIKQRVIAESTWDRTGTTPLLSDSASFGYTNTLRGSSFNYNMMAYFYTYPGNSNFGYEYLVSSPDRFDVKADSIRHWTDNGSGLALAENNKIIYNAANRIADYMGYDLTVTPAFGDRYIHTYDAQGRLSKRINLEDNGSGWDTVGREFFYYNAQGNVRLDSAEEYSGVNIWSPYVSFVYTYDVSGNPTNISLKANIGGGTFIPVVTFDNTFYTNNTLKTSALSINQGGTGVEPAYLDSFGYTSGINYYTYLKEYQYDANTSAWVPAYRETRHTNSQNLPDTLTASQWDGSQWVPASKNVYTYNSYNNPATVATYTLPATTPDYTGTYYYEQYNDQSSVPNTPAVAQDIKTYPNPTSGNLSINWSNAIIGTPVTISIAGMNGQLVYSESLRWNQPVQQLSVGFLQPGIYAMVITDEKGTQVFHQNIVKQ